MVKKKVMTRAIRYHSRAIAYIPLGAILAVFLSACSPLGALKSAYEGEPFPQLPPPEIATYILDLSSSTNPTAQLEALGSGINEFVAGRSLGNPFSTTPAPPRGLSIQFITKNSAQAPRILLVSTKTSRDLYAFIKEKSSNLEGALQFWDGLINVRTQIWQDPLLQSNRPECVSKVVELLGRQQLLPDALQVPASIICKDTVQTAAAFEKLRNFVSNPGVPMGSDVKGAIEAGLKNLATAKVENSNARLTLVVASDLVDTVSLALNNRLANLDSQDVCALAAQDASKTSNDYSSVNVVIVGGRNSRVNSQTLDNVQIYWTCYLNQVGVTNITEQSDLSGY